LNIVEWRFEVEVVVILFGFAMQHRPFSEGEGIRGMRPKTPHPDLLLSEKAICAQPSLIEYLFINGVFNNAE
jgi:hypothetical protein